jgi:ATP-binding cassette subfamily F protein 3
MLLAGLQNVTMRYAAQTVLRGVSFQISSGQKIGFIGPNGAGKTTALRLMLGQETPVEGNAFVARGVRVGYVPQRVEYAEGKTVRECLLEEFHTLTAELGARERALSEAAGAELDSAMRAYQRARDEYDRIDGHWLPERAQAMLEALGLVGRAEQPVGSLSGGEKNVLALARALLEDPELLLLDEPGNHLDYVGLAWLEDFLVRFKGAVLIVSHNRYLLDRVVDGILHLEGGSVSYYGGNYSEYRLSRLRQLVAQQADYVANQKRLARLEALVQRFAEIARNSTDPAWGRRLHARRTQLERERQAAVERPNLGPSAIQPDFGSEVSRANIAMQLRGYTKAFGELELFRKAELDVRCGERVALVGPNGSGKTTLLRDVITTGRWENPTIRVGPSMQVGYCAQEQEVLQPERTVLETVMSAGLPSPGAARAVLARFLFFEQDAGKLVANLSGGERNRLQLALLMVLKPNFLILDEPTNHMDIPAREAIEDALADYEGTILVVSHDRYFLDKVVERVVEVRDRKLVSHAGNFSDFWSRRRSAMPRAVGRVSTRRKARERSAAAPAGQLSELERRIGVTEQRKVELEGRMETAFLQNNRREARRCRTELERLQKELDRLYEKWFAQG